MEEKKSYSVKELASILGCSVTAVQKKITQDENNPDLRRYKKRFDVVIKDGRTVILLSDSDIEEEKRYKLNYLDRSICSLIPYETLRKLNNSLNHNAISIFVYLLKRYIANEEKEYPVTMLQMKKFIGIATSTTSNNEVINDILEVLSLLGLVKYELRQVEQDKTVIYITYMNNMIGKNI